MDKISKSAIRKIGERLKNDSATQADLSLMSEYRTNHIYLTKMLIQTIKDKLPPPILIARRLKRLGSIVQKLKRFDSMELDRMQDIGGVRAVFNNNGEVREYADNIKKIYSHRNSAFQIVRENDYITTPKQDGYTSYHIVFKYVGSNEYLKGYHLELQLRDVISHAWATAVEVFALGSDMNLKIGQGDEVCRRFFALTSKLLRGDKGVRDEIRAINGKCKILEKLSGLSVATDKIIRNDKKADFYLITLNYKTRMLQLTGYSEKNLALAQSIYQAMETSNEMDSVLVGVNDVKKLKRAYPNYFLDATYFITKVKGLLAANR